MTISKWLTTGIETGCDYMASLDSTKKDATWHEWREQLETMLEINGYNPAFCDIEAGSLAEVAYHDGLAVDDFFYENYEACE